MLFPGRVFLDYVPELWSGDPHEVPQLAEGDLLDITPTAGKSSRNFAANQERSVRYHPHP